MGSPVFAEPSLSPRFPAAATNWALDLMGALKLGVHIGLDEIRADEFSAMLIIAEERDLLEREQPI